MSGQTPRPEGNATAYLTDEQTRRVRRVVARWTSVREAAKGLGVSDLVLANARGGGRMKRSTVEKVMAAVEREETR